MGTLPLARHASVRSRDLDEVRAGVADAFCPHTLSLVDGSTRLDARFHSVQLGAVGLHYLDYGAGVRITPRRLQDFFLVQIPVRGKAHIRSGRSEIVSDVGAASVPDPESPLTMTWAAGNAQLIVWLDRAALEDELRLMLGREPAEPLRMDLGLDLRDAGVRAWLDLVNLVRRDLDGPGLVAANEVARRQAEGLIMSQLLLAHRHNHREALRAGPPAAPKCVRRAAELFDAHAAEPLTVQEVAEAVGVSARALQEGFRRHLDTTPMQYLRDARLARAHEALAAADPATTSVARVASACGFVHLGRFAAEYHARYGTRPSDTLRG